MYQWYEKSAVCYAYLEDVEDVEDVEGVNDNACEESDEDIGDYPINTDNDSTESVDWRVKKSIRDSRWFTRG
jgi:hypothetical protein